nr:uncharacterized protein LOC117854440 [Setaria viridis]
MAGLVHPIRQEDGLDDKGKKPMFASRLPREGWIKINVDGAFTERGEAGIGVVIRAIFNAASAEEVEITACKEGIMLAAEWSPKPAVLESDCLSAINLLSKPECQRSPSAFIIKEAARAAEGLPAVLFRHVKREQNSVAHELAQLARRLFHSAVWRTRAPACVEHLVARDCNSPLSN